MPAGVAGFHGKEPLFGPVREGEHTLPRGLARDGRGYRAGVSRTRSTVTLRSGPWF
jgi:hypothetical protein